MKNGLQLLIFIGLSGFLMNCGNNSSITTNDVSGSSRGGIPPINIQDLEDGGFEDRIVSIDLDLDEDLIGYDSIELRVDIGAVLGTGQNTRYGGDVIAYVDYEGGGEAIRFFSSGGNTRADVEENYWYFSNSGQEIWRGVFEGPRGALIIVIDDVYNSGDGNPAFDLMGGAVWLKPWPVAADPGVSERPCVIKEDGRVDCKNPSGPLVRCWNVSLGPYDCRFNISDNGENVRAVGNRLYPGGEYPYVRLGTFTELSKRDTFKENY